MEAAIDKAAQKTQRDLKALINQAQIPPRATAGPSGKENDAQIVASTSDGTHHQTVPATPATSQGRRHTGGTGEDPPASMHAMPCKP